jgi:hypothetical protein
MMFVTWNINQLDNKRVITMGVLAEGSVASSKDRAAGMAGPRLAGVWFWVAVTAWAVILLMSLVSAANSISNLYIWDSVPAGELKGYFHFVEPEVITSRTEFQNEVMALGFSLGGFASLLTAFRVIGSLSAFILSALLVWRYPRHLMAVLFACLLAVMGAAGIWQNTLFGWAPARAPWLEVPVQVLNLLLWFGLIFLYTFPDGRFKPRWTIALVILLIPIVLSMIFDLPIFLNPGTWPDPLPLLPNLVFIGVAFFSVLYRYLTADPARKAQLKGFVVGVSLLMTLYFIQFFLIDVYGAVTGESPFATLRALLIYILISEPLWFALEVFFVIRTAQSILRDRLLEG